MNTLARPLVAIIAAAIFLVAAVGSIRWAKGHSRGAQFVASAMILVLGITTPIVTPPQQGIEEAREDKGKKGSESGDPPTT